MATQMSTYLFRKIPPNDKVALLVKEIMVFENSAAVTKTVLPFYADGLPGLIFHITPDGQWVQPHNKQMPASYLHGLTINPLELHMDGQYKIIAFQLYPFVISGFFNLNPKDINDGCFDLSTLDNWNKIIHQLNESSAVDDQIYLIQEFLYNEFLIKKEKIDVAVREAIHCIFRSDAQLSVQELADKVHLTLRTFQRRFLAEVGVAPKEFIQMIKFQLSLGQLTVKEYNKLTDIVYRNGFADQSHFIRVFKSFTGKTPKHFVK